MKFLICQRKFGRVKVRCLVAPSISAIFGLTFGIRVLTSDSCFTPQELSENIQVVFKADKTQFNLVPSRFTKKTAGSVEKELGTRMNG